MAAPDGTARTAVHQENATAVATSIAIIVKAIAFVIDIHSAEKVWGIMSNVPVRL